MTTSNQSPHDTIEQARKERPAGCAEPGQAVPVEKRAAFEHYTRLAAELLAEQGR